MLLLPIVGKLSEMLHSYKNNVFKFADVRIMNKITCETLHNSLI